ncbi:EAL domain-containing protein [Alcaligenaceae bacterium A4P071]|nr:EAL domain-containing protein [Alcaligenaceae bacterium A4P071]
MISVDADVETARLRAVDDYGMMDDFVHVGLDRLVQLTRNIFHAPIALVSLVEAERQLFVSRVGIGICATAREDSFCAHALASTEVMLVPDTHMDPRFAGNALVVGPPFIRFYAGCPLVSPSGFILGTLCIIDTAPRPPLNDRDLANLRDLAALVEDQLELRRLELARQASQTRFEMMAKVSPDAIICTDDKATVTFWNPAAERMLGYSAASIIGRPIEVFAPIETMQRCLAIAADETSPYEGRTVELGLRTREGDIVQVEVSSSVWRESGRLTFCAILRDVSERLKNEERLFQLAQMDPLTGLGNRALFRYQVEAAIAVETDGCLMMIDLDGFKDVNDTLGHPGGDAVLITVAKRLTAGVRTGDVLARMGGDEFAIFLPGMGDTSTASELAHNIIESLSASIIVDGLPVTIGASVGIAMLPTHGQTVQKLLSSADLALYEAKAQGKHCLRFYTPALRDMATAKRAYQAEFARALSNGEFEVHYQPQFRLADNTLIGAEALLRWRHPEKGLLPPSAFLGTLEASPLAAKVGNWALEVACEQAFAWQKRIRDFRIGVNLFSAQLRDGNFFDTVQEILHRTNLAFQTLELEIPGGVLLRDDQHAATQLHHLRAAGVSILFDDYGAGVVSLNTLKRFPLTRLKIDQSFVRGMLTHKEDAAIIRAILFLGKSLGLSVAAEGVETVEQSTRLRAKGCEEAQGYLFGKPMPADTFALMLCDQYANLH